MIGKSLGAYEILTLLGKGGMGEVYRARDPKLERDVAIKVLPAEFAKDEERLLRFRREAKLLASLEHPHIAAIHGFETVEGEGGEPTHYLVLEYVEGISLSRRLENGPLPVDEALELCEQIAEGLESAHDKGIVHRDLKPGNVMLRPDGNAKILDFGLARAMAEESSTSASAQSPTITADYTQPGVVLGTAAYMSPEQARGRSVDRRTDIFSFGCVLYECLTGKVLFTGESATESMGAILHKEPEWSLLPSGTPPTVQLLLRRCLTKDRKRRLQAIGDARVELQEAIADPTSSSTGFPGPPAERRGGNRLRAVVAVLAGAAITGAAMTLLRPDPPRPLQRFEIAVDPLPASAALALSRDGRRLAYIAGPLDDRKIFVKRLDEAGFRPLDATSGAGDPFFSPDGEWLAFHDTGALKAVRFSGGPAREITAGLGFGGGIWGEDDTITIAGYLDGTPGAYAVPAEGGEARMYVGQDPERQVRTTPHLSLLPGGRGFVGSVDRGEPPDERPIELYMPGTGESKALSVTGIDPRYAPTGHLLYVQGGNLWAVPFDPESWELAGTPVPVVEGVALSGSRAAYAFSQDGTLIYEPAFGGDGIQRELVWLDREGNEETLPVDPDGFLMPRLSPDGQRLAITIAGPEAAIHVYEIGSRRPPVRVTFGEGQNTGWPVWSPDGARLFYYEGVSRSVLSIPTDLSSLEPQSVLEPFTDSLHVAWPSSVSPDNGELILQQMSVENGLENAGGVYGLPLDEPSEQRALVDTPAGESHPRLSPDGSWLAYATNLSGRSEVRVRPYPDTAAAPPAIVSVAGGSHPVWRGNSQELFYLEERALMAVSVPSDSETEWGEPQKLFDLPASAHLGGPVQVYDVDPDGNRFLVMKNTRTDDVVAEPRGHLVVLLNWFPELERLAPRGK